MAQTRETAPELSFAIDAAAAARNSSAAGTGLVGKHEQELLAAAGSEEDTGEPEFRQQGARQNFREQIQPAGAAEEGLFRVNDGGRTEKLVAADRPAEQEDLN